MRRLLALFVVRPAPRLLVVAAVLGVLLVAGCGEAGESVSGDGDEGADPIETPAGSDLGDGAAVVAEASEGSAAEFAAEVVGRLLQTAFYAEDASSADGVVAPERVEVVLGVLDGLVADARWAIATAPGSTERSWFVAAPLTVDVTGFDPETGVASVEVWVVTVFSRQGLAGPQSRFVLETAELWWDGGRWWVTDLVVDPGPAAALAAGEVPATPVELDDALAGHELIPGRVHR